MVDVLSLQSFFFREFSRCSRSSGSRKIFFFEPFIAKTAFVRVVCVSFEFIAVRSAIAKIEGGSSMILLVTNLVFYLFGGLVMDNERRGITFKFVDGRGVIVIIRGWSKFTFG